MIAEYSENTEEATQQQPQKSLAEMVEDLAGIFLPIPDMADIFGIDAEELRSRINQPGSPLNIAYRRGKAQSKVTLLRQQRNLAQLGSPAALAAMNDALLSMEDKE